MFSIFLARHENHDPKCLLLFFIFYFVKVSPQYVKIWKTNWDYNFTYVGITIWSSLVLNVYVHKLILIAYVNRAFALIYLKFYVYFSVTFFFFSYFTQTICKNNHIRIFILHPPLFKQSNSLSLSLSLSLSPMSQT